MMLTLGLNTTGPACDLALLDGATLLAEAFAPMKRGQDARLPGLLHTLIVQASVQFLDLDRIVVVTGPGSFTGIRVGVAFARGLALALKRPCIGVTSLEAALPGREERACVVALPAQRRAPDITYWVQTFKSGRATGPCAEITLEALAGQLEEAPQPLFGSADALVSLRPDILFRQSQPSAAAAARFGAELDPAAHRPNPTYVRAPDAAPPQQSRLSQGK